MRQCVAHFKSIVIVLLVVMPSFAAGCAPARTSNPPVIEVWYGDEQHFGRLGMPQKWVNVLGCVVSDDRRVTLRYSLNGTAPSPLSLGSDGERLARNGDFNIELDPAALRDGANTVTLVATDAAGRRSERTVTVHYHPGKVWSLPYTVDWSKVRSITDAVQVVDGHWKLDPDGVRTVDRYYDRTLAFGDRTWTDYTVTVAVTFHSFAPPLKGPPTYGVSHAGIAARWPGHADDGRQPRVKWYPLGAIAAFRLSKNLDRCSWRMHCGGDERTLPTKLPEPRTRPIRLGVRYMMKLRVDSLPDSAARYRVKAWKDGEPEPAAWDLDAKEGGRGLPAGGALIIAHNTDVTFGTLTAAVNDARE